MRAIVAGLLTLAPIAAQGEGKPQLAPEDGRNCPYCQGDPELMARAGIVSHGGFPFGRSDTADVTRFLASLEVRWIETKHFELGFALGPDRIGDDERAKLRPELVRLRALLPLVPEKPRIMDPWLRLHVYAQRVEDLYARMLTVLAVSESDFPPTAQKHVLGEPFFGNGPYLGEEGKYEAMVLPNAAFQVSFLQEQFGLSVRRTQRWNITDRETMTVVMNVEEDHLYSDEAIHGHVVFNLVHNLICGYKHYSYDTPLWIQEGLAHYLERKITTRYNSFSFSEGGLADEVHGDKWDVEVKKLVRTEEIPSVAEVFALKEFAAFKARHHLACWSMVAFLLETHPEGFACLNARLHGRLTADGFPDGSNLGDAQRDAFRECFDLSYTQFEQAWHAWVLNH